jgi:glycine/D-amino acid oxidase-like deaminating enzyme
VIHATNAWLSQLLPELWPLISPVRGNVVAYAPSEDDHGGPKSALGLDPRYSLWLRYGAKDYDYLIQRKDGVVVVGRANTGRKATGDDSETDLSPMTHLRGFADVVAASPVPGASRHITHSWAGILAFSQDGVPFAGKIPFAGRSHQWVCGGYHATGMIKAFLTSQMVAGQILGEDLPKDFPRSILITEERFRALRRSVEQVKLPVLKARP